MKNLNVLTDTRDRELKKRRKANLALRQEAWRENVKFKKCLNNILAVDNILKAQWRTLESEAVQALRARAEINFRLMSKLLPDLKQMDVTSAGSQVNNVGVALVNLAPSEEAWVKAASAPPRLVLNDEEDVVEEKQERTVIERT